MLVQVSYSSNSQIHQILSPSIGELLGGHPHDMGTDNLPQHFEHGIPVRGLGQVVLGLLQLAPSARLLNHPWDYVSGSKMRLQAITQYLNKNRQLRELGYRERDSIRKKIFVLFYLSRNIIKDLNRVLSRTSVERRVQKGKHIWTKSCERKERKSGTQIDNKMPDRNRCLGVSLSVQQPSTRQGQNPPCISAICTHLDKYI